MSSSISSRALLVAALSLLLLALGAAAQAEVTSADLAARRALAEEGYIILKDAVPQHVVQEARAATEAHEERWTTPTAFTYPDSTAPLFAAWALEFGLLERIKAITGWARPQLSGGGIMWNVPKSDWHRDLGFMEEGAPWKEIDGDKWQTYKVVLYLQDHSNDTCGLTLDLGSHLRPGNTIDHNFESEVPLSTSLGDVIVFDVRALHAGGNWHELPGDMATRGYWMLTVQPADNAHAKRRSLFEWLLLDRKHHTRGWDWKRLDMPEQVVERLQSIGWEHSERPSESELHDAMATMGGILAAKAGADPRAGPGLLQAMLDKPSSRRTRGGAQHADEAVKADARLKAHRHMYFDHEKVPTMTGKDPGPGFHARPRWHSHKKKDPEL